MFRIVCTVALLLGCATATRQQTAKPVSVPNVESSSAAEEVVTRTNAERAKLKLPALRRSAELMKAAQLQADQMAATHVMAHDLPGAAFPTPSSRLQAVGYPAGASGENVAEGYSDPASVVAGWMTSPHHRDNIVSDHYIHMGAGVALGSNNRRYWVQVFAKPL